MHKGVHTAGCTPEGGGPEATFGSLFPFHCWSVINHPEEERWVGREGPLHTVRVPRQGDTSSSMCTLPAPGCTCASSSPTSGSAARAVCRMTMPWALFGRKPWVGGLCLSQGPIPVAVRRRDDAQSAPLFLTGKDERSDVTRVSLPYYPWLRPCCARWPSGHAPSVPQAGCPSACTFCTFMND